MKTRKLLFVGLLFALIMAACGGGGADEPADVVEKAMQAIAKMDADEGAKYVCEAQKDEFTSSFGDLGSDLLGLTGADFDPDKVRDAMTIKMEDMKYEEKSKDEDKAVVHLEGTMQIKFEADKLKGLVKEAAEASGESVSDEELDMVMGMVEGMLAEGLPIDDDMPLIKEGGKWVICPEE